MTTAAAPRYRGPADLEEVRAALSYIPAHDRELWVRLSMAVKAELGDDGFALWDAWSQTDEEGYNPRDARAVWRSMKGNGIGIGTLYHEAKARGFRPSSKTGPALSPEQTPEIKAQREQKRLEDERKAQQRAAKARQTAGELWNRAEPAPESHPYLNRKGIGAHGARVARYTFQVLNDHGEWEPRAVDNCLLIPLRDADGLLENLQVIFPERDPEFGDKRFFPGARVSGLYYLIGKPGGVICVCEGFATGASIHEAAGYAIAVAFNAGNLVHVARKLRETYPEATIIVCGDNDQSTTGNPGATKAREAAQAVDGVLALPVFKDMTGEPTDFNDLAQLEGLAAVKEQIQAAARPEAQAAEDASEPADDSAAPSLQEEITRLADLPPLEYDRVRTTEAKRLGVRPPTLDDEVKRARRASEGGSGGGRVLEFATPEPWESPVAGAALLDEIAAMIRRFMVLPEHADMALALWVVHTYAYDLGRTTSMLAVVSPEKRCGKSTLLAILRRLVSRPMIASNISPSAIFRCVESSRPTLLIDEADSFLKDNEELRNILNSGHTRDTAHVVRLVAKGDDYEARQFTTWAPKAIALIGKLPPTLHDRSICVPLRRKAPGEVVERLSIYTDAEHDVQRKCVRFASDHAAELARRMAEIAVPERLHDRAADNWRPLLALAELAGGRWPAEARRAAEALTDGTDDAEGAAVQLLEDIRLLFEKDTSGRLHSENIVNALEGMEERPWAEWNRGKPITKNQVARLLKPFQIKSTTFRHKGTNGKGYLLEQFADAFTRYLRPPSPSASVTPQQGCDSSDLQHNRSVTGATDVTDEKAQKHLENEACYGVTDENPVTENPRGWEQAL